MSTSFYKSAPPQLLKAIRNKVTKKSIEVWRTSCIVTNFGKNQDLTGCTVLINPANPELSGVSNFPYFPRGGPVPDLKPKTMHADWQPLGYVSNWGGMEVGSGMLYPASVVDGLVHQLGGMKLALQCKLLRAFKGCPTGTSISTSQGDEALIKMYDEIIHTAPPFYEHDKNPIESLRSCYTSALDIAFESGSVVACPLIGAGARGFPTDEAIMVAAAESLKWIDVEGTEMTEESRGKILRFGIPDSTTAYSLIDAMKV